MNLEILLATSNAHKLEEFRRILAPHGITLYGMNDLNMPPLEVNEDGDTYFKNAQIKLLALRKLTSFPILADDSGLELEAFPNLLGLHTSRYAKGYKDQKEANESIIKLYDNNPSLKRDATFKCALCFSLNDGDLRYFDGKMPGFIGKKATYAHGFGYDPIFISKEKNQCVASLNDEEKDAISHRGKACKKLLTYLKIKGLIK